MRNILHMCRPASRCTLKLNFEALCSSCACYGATLLLILGVKPCKCYGFSALCYRLHAQHLPHLTLRSLRLLHRALLSGSRAQTGDLHLFLQSSVQEARPPDSKPVEEECKIVADVVIVRKPVSVPDCVCMYACMCMYAPLHVCMYVRHVLNPAYQKLHDDPL